MCFWRGRHFNPQVATAAAVTICEAEQVVEPGALDPDQVHLPGIYVKRLVQGRDYQKWIERRTTRPRAGEGSLVAATAGGAFESRDGGTAWRRVGSLTARVDAVLWSRSPGAKSETLAVRSSGRTLWWDGRTVLTRG